MCQHPDGHVLQTSVWGIHQSEFGWRVERVALMEEGVIVAGAQIFLKPLPFGLTRAYVPKGPLVNLDDDRHCRQLIDALHKLCRARRAILLKLEPDWLDAERAALFARYGFKLNQETVQPPRTILIDLNGSEDDILARMKSKVRYNIRLAERKGVQVRAGTRADMDAYNRLRVVTGERDDFDVHSEAYYNRAYELFVPQELARLFVATYHDQPLAAILAMACGRKAWYMYGASGNEHRDKMPNYALQWAAICWARERGCMVYDLWGVPDEDETTLEGQFSERDDGLWGVYRFKRGWGGRVVRYVGAFNYIYNQPLHRLYRLALRMKYR
ncbi:MAG: peptidoglycan bridge formation glycyltransferase FemA/FemB family protein [Anaerolineae bacterium]|nr:peptidoglycan bridge formation glycyltransferase FemA/FemB family protein [Anaerolineae bacterium]